MSAGSSIGFTSNVLGPTFLCYGWTRFKKTEAYTCADYLGLSPRFPKHGHP